MENIRTTNDFRADGDNTKLLNEDCFVKISQEYNMNLRDFYPDYKPENGVLVTTLFDFENKLREKKSNYQVKEMAHCTIQLSHPENTTMFKYDVSLASLLESGIVKARQNSLLDGIGNATSNERQNNIEDFNNYFVKNNEINAAKQLKTMSDEIPAELFYTKKWSELNPMSLKEITDVCNTDPSWKEEIINKTTSNVYSVYKDRYSLKNGNDEGLTTVKDRVVAVPYEDERWIKPLLNQMYTNGMDTENNNNQAFDFLKQIVTKKIDSPDIQKDILTSYLGMEYRARNGIVTPSVSIDTLLKRQKDIALGPCIENDTDKESNITKELNRKFIESLRNKTCPYMLDNDDPYYAVDPLKNNGRGKVYPDATQSQLLLGNAERGEININHVDINLAITMKPSWFSKKEKLNFGSCNITYTGRDANGNKEYKMVIAAKGLNQNVLNDDPVKQPAIEGIGNVNLQKKSYSNMEDMLKSEIGQYMNCAFTKTPFKASSGWTEEIINKIEKELEKNPNLFIKCAKNGYEMGGKEAIINKENNTAFLNMVDAQVKASSANKPKTVSASR